MIKNYLLVAFRNLWRHRGFSAINILGLTVGRTAFYLIFLYVRFELTYDHFHTKADRIFRIVADIKTPTETRKVDGPAWAVGPHLPGEFPEVEAAVRISPNDLLVRRGDVHFQETNSLFADSNFFTMFDFPLKYGDPKTALKEPYSIVLSETAAKKYFGDVNPVGEHVLLTILGWNAVITGVMRDLPENTMIQGDMIVSMTTISQKVDSTRDNDWQNYGLKTYVMLRPGTDYKRFQSRLPAFLEKLDGREMRESQDFPTLLLEPVKDIHMYSTRDDNKTGNIGKIYILSAIALFILLIACFNFVNLTTARSTERAKEVGIRKVIGAKRNQLARQFIGESVILCLIAWILTLALSTLLLPMFNSLSGKTLHPGYFLELLGLAMAIGLLAGIYPALVLSSYRPVAVLKGRFTTGSKGTLLRKALVVAQFTISITLMIGTIVVYAQMTFMRKADLGYNKDQKIIIDTEGDPNRDAFRNSLTGLPHIRSVTMSGLIPGKEQFPQALSRIQNVRGEMQSSNLDVFFVDFDFIPEYQMKMLAGRAFNKTYGTDTTQAMIVNESALKLFGYTRPDQILGQKFDQWGRQGTIIGVVKDFHLHSLQEAIQPMTMRIEPQGCYLVTVNVDAGANIPGILKAIESAWHAAFPVRPFSYYFLDEFFDRQYRNDERFGNIFLDFAVLAILISCMGLLGLASYSTLQRRREIGIRKVLGASTRAIVQLLTTDFVRLVALSFVLATPLAAYFMHHWLEGFAYRTSLTWWMFIIAGLTALIIAMLTVCYQALKAAIANPVKSLRTE
jgi:putative ABC transport system permease protein